MTSCILKYTLIKKGGLNMGNSKLVDYTLISPNKTIGRNHSIDTITIHCFVGQVTVEGGCGWLKPIKNKVYFN